MVFRATSRTNMPGTSVRGRSVQLQCVIGLAMIKAQREIFAGGVAVRRMNKNFKKKIIKVNKKVLYTSGMFIFGDL